jgi:hypothetical protein
MEEGWRTTWDRGLPASGRISSHCNLSLQSSTNYYTPSTWLVSNLLADTTLLRTLPSINFVLWQPAFWLFCYICPTCESEWTAYQREGEHLPIHYTIYQGCLNTEAFPNPSSGAEETTRKGQWMPCDTGSEPNHRNCWRWDLFLPTIEEAASRQEQGQHAGYLGQFSRVFHQAPRGRAIVQCLVRPSVHKTFWIPGELPVDAFGK